MEKRVKEGKEYKRGQDRVSTVGPDPVDAKEIMSTNLRVEGKLRAGTNTAIGMLFCEVYGRVLVLCVRQVNCGPTKRVKEVERMPKEEGSGRAPGADEVFMLKRVWS